MNNTWEEAYKSATVNLLRMEHFEENPEKIAQSIKSDLEVIAQAASTNLDAAEALSNLRQKIYELIETSKKNIEQAKAEIVAEKKRSSVTKAYEKALHLGK